MDHLAIIAAILFVNLFALISPGPNFVLVTSGAVSKSRAHAVWTGVGLAAGSLIWASAAAFGVTSVFEVLPWLGVVLKLLGIGYLIYLGIKLLRSNGFAPVAHAAERPVASRQGFSRGLLANLTNPKSAAYYTSVFAAFLTPEMPLWVLAVLIGCIVLMSLIWYCGLALALSARTVQRRYTAVSRTVDRICGGLLVFLGLRLAWEIR